LKLEIIKAFFCTGALLSFAFADEFGRKTVLQYSSILCAVSCLMCSFSGKTFELLIRLINLVCSNRIIIFVYIRVCDGMLYICGVNVTIAFSVIRKLHIVFTVFDGLLSRGQSCCLLCICGRGTTKKYHSFPSVVFKHNLVYICLYSCCV
jgi:hypothetical protein